MDDLLPQRQFVETAVRISLVDYVVLRVVDEWTLLTRSDARATDSLAREQAGERLRGVTILVAGELVRDGFLIELALQFKSLVLPGLGIVTSEPIDDSIRSMIRAKCLAPPDPAVPLYTLTRTGDFYLQMAGTRINIYEEEFLQLRDIFFNTADLIRYYLKTASKVRLRARISDMVRDCYTDSIPDLRLKLIRLGAHLVDEGAPRGYYFDEKYGELASLQKKRPGELPNVLPGELPTVSRSTS